MDPVSLTSFYLCPRVHRADSTTLSCLQPAVQHDPSSDGAAYVFLLRSTSVLYRSSTSNRAEKISEIQILSSLHYLTCIYVTQFLSPSSVNWLNSILIKR